MNDDIFDSELNLGDDFDIATEENNTEEKPYRKRYHKKKKKKITVGRILVGILFIFFGAYFAALIYTSNFSIMETEQADAFEVNDCVEAEGIALRSEEYITNSKKGIISYTVENGEKVEAGGTVAKLFNSESEVEAWQHHNEVESELELLKQMTSSSESLFVNLDTVDVQINKKLVELKNQTAQNKLTTAAQTKLDLLKLFNERTVVTGGSANFAPRINELQTELDSIKVSDGIGSVKSKKSGFFSSLLDGYELSLDYGKAESLTVDDVNAMVKKDPPSDAVGKIVNTINWYLLCPVSSEQALTVSSGDNVVEVSIPRVMSGSIPATVVGVNQSSKTSNGLLILKSDYIDGTIEDIRRENISIKTYTYEGLRISRSAIHEDYVSVQDYDEEGNKVGEPHQEKVQGVYVVYGKRLSFVQVKIIYSDNDFVICSDDASDPEILTGKTLALHDTVVVKGKELYDGKIVR